MKRTLAVFGIALSFILLPACGGSSGGDGGGNNEANFVDACSAVGLARTKVANGEACSFGEDPAASPIVRLNLFSDQGAEVCTGAAITSNIVLTAAHCLLSSPSVIQVDTFGGSHSASRYSVHPGFTVSQSGGGFLFINDIAIVQTSTPMSVATAPILVTRAPQVGELSIVSGFGETSPGSGDAPINAGNAIVTLVTQQHVGIEFEGNQAHPCQGDSGGPILVREGNRWGIAGVVSQSDPSIPVETVCRVGDSTLYTNVQDPSTLEYLAGEAPTADVL